MDYGWISFVVIRPDFIRWIPWRYFWSTENLFHRSDWFWDCLTNMRASTKRERADRDEGCSGRIRCTPCTKCTSHYQYELSREHAWGSYWKMDRVFGDRDCDR